VAVAVAVAVAVVVVVVRRRMRRQPFILHHCYFKPRNTTTVYESAQFSNPQISVPI
jgi:hypothetical protein